MLSLLSAAPLLCAGVTAYGALKKVSLHATGGKIINIIGCGGVGRSPLFFEAGYAGNVYANL